MRKFYSIFALCAFLFLSVSIQATDYTIPSGSPVVSWALPLYMGNTTDGAGSFFGSITQQIYLAEDLTAQEASAGNITAATFYYTSKSGTASAITPRNIVIYLMESDIDEYPMHNFPYQDIYDVTQDKYLSYFLYDNDNKAGVKVFEGTLATEEVTSPIVKEVTLTFNVNNFAWSGTKNIVMTLVDKSATTHASTNLRFHIVSTKTNAGSVSHPRFLDTYWTTSSDERASWINTSSDSYDFSGKLGEFYGKFKADNLTESSQKSQRSYVPKVTFSISSLPTPSVPTGLAASDISNTSTLLSWNTASSASSYELQSSTNGEDWSALASSISGTSYSWTGLTASTTYYVRVRAVNAVGNSDWSEPLSFTTLAPHIHDGITFEPWSNPAALPTSGNYFLNTDVELASDWNVTENINLCLNGHEVYTETNSIQVKDGATFAIYDNEGGGRIYGYFVANYPEYGLINIENGGTLVLSEGTIQNLYGSYEEDDDPDDKSLSNAIYNNGTLKLSGALTFTSYHADIYLGSNKYITIESEKPLTNSEPYSVYKSGKSVITSGWANMNGADPKDYFVSANTSLNIKMGETEAEFYPVISLSENNTNTAIGTYSGQTVDVNLTRSLTPSQYNTFCLPFALDDDQLQELFGTGYDLEEFVSSSLKGDVLSLSFNKVTSLEAGKPYLLQPSVEVTNPSFEGVTIGATAPVDIETSLIDFKGTFNPTELEVGNHNILCLGASNSLFWPNTSNPIKGFRAYFEVKGDAKKAKAAHIVKKEDQAQALDNIENTRPAQKRILNGQLVIEKNGTFYNAQGQIVK